MKESLSELRVVRSGTGSTSSSKTTSDDEVRTSAHFFLQSLRNFLMIGFMLLLILFIAEITVSLITMHMVNRQLGFSYSTPETPVGEPFLITRVVDNKTMDKAGLKAGDQVQMRSTSELYRLLIKNQRKEAVFNVLRDDKIIEITVKVPEMKLPLRRISLLL